MPGNDKPAVPESAQALPWWRRWRGAFVGIMVGVLVFTGWECRQPVWRWAQVRYYQWQCLHYSRPADQIVAMEGSQADVAALGATDPRYIVDLTNSAQYKSLTAFAAHTAAPLDRLEAILQLPLQYSNGPPGSGWHSWGSASIGETDAAAMPRCPVLFLHARTSQAGHERLVVVTIDRLFYQRVVWLLDAQAYEVGQGGPRHIFSRGRASGIGLRSFYQKTGGDMGGINDIRFFAGQPDPNDASQFTIPYKMNSESGTIVGQLKDDDGIELKPDGPIAQHKIFWPRTD